MKFHNIFCATIFTKKIERRFTMLTLDEQIKQTEEKVTQLKQQRRIQIKKEKDIRKKKDQRRNYIIGELVSKHFPEILNLEPGTKSQNAVTFEPLDAFLSVLAADPELVNQIKNRISN